MHTNPDCKGSGRVTHSLCDILLQYFMHLTCRFCSLISGWKSTHDFITDRFDDNPVVSFDNISQYIKTLCYLDAGSGITEGLKQTRAATDICEHYC